MEHLNQIRQTRTEGQVQTLVLALKVCPVCDSLTRIEADHCGLCNWCGQFNTDVNLVADALTSLLEKCPELLSTLAPSTQTAPSFMTRLREVLTREINIRKRLDMSA